MSGVCVDTSAYSHLMRGREALRVRLEEADTVYVPATVLGELHAGFEMGSRPRDNAAQLREFLEQPAVRIVDTDENVAQRFYPAAVSLAEGSPSRVILQRGDASRDYGQGRDRDILLSDGDQLRVDSPTLCLLRIIPHKTW